MQSSASKSNTTHLESKVPPLLLGFQEKNKLKQSPLYVDDPESLYYTSNNDKDLDTYDDLSFTDSFSSSSPNSFPNISNTTSSTASSSTNTSRYNIDSKSIYECNNRKDDLYVNLKTIASTLHSSENRIEAPNSTLGYESPRRIFSTPRRRWSLSVVNNSLLSNSNSDNQSLLESSITEFLLTETEYYHDLALYCDFVLPKISSSLSKKKINNLEINMKSLLDLHQQFLSRLKTRKKISALDLALDLKSISNEVKSLYCTYHCSYNDALEMYHSNKDRKSKLNIKMIEDAEEMKGQTIGSLLIKPVQRIPRYSLMLGNIYKYSSDPIHKDIIYEVQTLYENITQDINTGMKKADMQKTLSSLLPRLDPKNILGLSTISGSPRKLVFQCECMMEMESKKKVSVKICLCSDVIFIYKTSKTRIKNSKVKLKSLYTLQSSRVYIIPSEKDFLWFRLCIIEDEYNNNFININLIFEDVETKILTENHIVIWSKFRERLQKKFNLFDPESDLLVITSCTLQGYSNSFIRLFIFNSFIGTIHYMQHGTICDPLCKCISYASIFSLRKIDDSILMLTGKGGEEKTHFINVKNLNTVYQMMECVWSEYCCNHPLPVVENDNNTNALINEKKIKVENGNEIEERDHLLLPPMVYAVPHSLFFENIIFNYEEWSTLLFNNHQIRKYLPDEIINDKLENNGSSTILYQVFEGTVITINRSMNMNTCCCTKGSLFGIESLILGSHSSDLYKAGPEDCSTIVIISFSEIQKRLSHCPLLLIKFRTYLTQLYAYNLSLLPKNLVP